MNGYPQMKLYRSASVSERHYVSTVNCFESGTELFNPLWQAAGIWLFLLTDWPSQCDPDWWRPVVLKVTGLVLDNLEGLQLSKVFKDLHNCRKSEKQLWSSREDEIKTLRTYQVDLLSIQSKGTELEDQQCLLQNWKSNHKRILWHFIRELNGASRNTFLNETQSLYSVLS